jgi:hypothetical protein
VLVALVAMLSFADLLAAAAGVNVTLIVQDAPAAKLAGQLFDCANHDAAVPVRLMLLTEIGTAPLFVSVAFSAALVVPTVTLPNLRLVGLTDAAGVRVNTFDLLTPLVVAEIVAEVFARTGLVEISNSTDFDPCGTETLAATG